MVHFYQQILLKAQDCYFFLYQYTKMDPIENTFLSVHSIGSILL